MIITRLFQHAVYLWIYWRCLINNLRPASCVPTILTGISLYGFFSIL